jgi:hypothetical protein
MIPMEMKQNIGAIISLIVGVGVAVLVIIFVSVLAGQTYQQVEPKLDTIGIASPGPTTAIRLTYDSQRTHLKWFTIPEAYTNGTITFWANGTSLTQNKFALHADNHTVKCVDNTYNNTDVNPHYTYDNATVRNYIKEGAISAFQGLSQTGSYLPIIVLAVVIVLILGLIMGMVGFRPNGGTLGGAL